MMQDIKKNQSETRDVASDAKSESDVQMLGKSLTRDHVQAALLHPDILEKINPRHPENKSTSFESMLMEQLNSPEFLKALKQFPDIHREKIIGFSIEYFIIHRDGFGFEIYLQNLAAQIPILGMSIGSADSEFMKVRTDLIIDSVAQKLGIPKTGIEYEERIVEYIKNNFIADGYYFHGFNGAVETHIKERGLDPHERLWDWEELSEIQKIGSRVGARMILGWAGLNSKGKIYIADNLENMYQYGVASPEWFAQFVAGGFHIPVDTPPYDKKAYYRRDYAAAKTNIVTMCDTMMSRSDEDIKAGKTHPKMTAEEKNKLLDFFEKYWAKFCNEQSIPKVAMIRRKAIGRDRVISFEKFNEYTELHRRLGMTQRTHTMAEYVEYILHSRENDTGVQELLSPQDIQIISLPKYVEVH